MDSFIKFFVKQKKLAIIFTVSIIIVGVITSLNIKRDSFPNVDLEIMSISVVYPGASSKDMELSITNKIEDELKNVSGIDTYTSISREGGMNIIVELEQDVDNVSEVKQNIKDAVNRVKDLPSDLKNIPVAIDIDPVRHILQVNLVDKSISYNDMRNIVNRLERELITVKGVSRVNKSGYLTPEIKIFLDKDAINKHKISLNDVLNAINKRNIRYTAGHTKSATDERNFVILAKFKNIDDVSKVVLLSSYDGPEIKLSDVAKIVYGNEKEEQITRVNGKKGFILRIKKQTNADLIRTVDLVKAKIATLKKNLPDTLDIFYTDDASFYVRNRLEIVTNNGIIGLILILVVLGVFLSIRSAFWVAISLPVVMFGLVILLQISNETINLVSLAAVILVLGLVVDDSIIVAESIHYYQQKKLSKYQAAAKGLAKVIAPIIITILTTMLAFSAMFLMSGILGKFIYIMPVVVIFALIISLLEVFIALPAHLVSNKVSKNRTWFIIFENWFEKISNVFLRFRYLVVLLFIAIFFASVFLASTMKFVLFPEVGTDKINAKIELELGSSLYQTEEIISKLEQIIFTVVGDDLDFISSEIGRYFNNFATIEIALTPATTRKLSGRDIHDKLVVATKDMTGAKKIEFLIRKPGPPVGNDVEINLLSDNDIQRKNASDDLANILENITGFNGLDRNDTQGKKRINIKLDFDAIGKFNLDITTITNYLRASLNGIEASTIRVGKDDVSFQVYVGYEGDIVDLKIPNKNRSLIPITQFAKLKYIDGESDYNHYNGERSVTISGNADDTKTTPNLVIQQALVRLNLANKYPEVHYALGGGSSESKNH